MIWLWLWPFLVDYDYDYAQKIIIIMIIDTLFVEAFRTELAKNNMSSCVKTA